MDKKIQHAAAHEPAYSEQAWVGMEKLLDKHLPQEKKRRRFIFWWFILPLAGAGLATGLWISRKLEKNTTQKIATTSISTNQSTATSTPAVKTLNSSKEKTTTPGVTTSYPAAPNDPVMINDKAAGSQINKLKTDNPLQQTVTNYNNTTVLTSVFDKSDYQISGTKQAVQKNRRPVKSKSVDIITDTNNESVPLNIATTQKNATTIHVVQAETKNDSATTLLISTTAKPIDSLLTTDTIATAKADTVSKQDKKAGESKWSVNVSLGPDVSAVSFANPGKTTLQYGAGISYAISPKWTIRSGFYASRKKYDADSADYTPPADYWNYISNLQKVNANCLLYEIPLSVVYSFSSNKKYSGFASAGISSVLMKEESYTYYYKNMAGIPRSYKRSYKNENNHFFSLLQFQLSPHMSLMAEPYLKIPLSGIGVGKVKLSSGGILFTAGINPFAKRK
jgi:hypothetical protein